MSASIGSVQRLEQRTCSSVSSDVKWVEADCCCVFSWALGTQSDAGTDPTHKNEHFYALKSKLKKQEKKWGNFICRSREQRGFMRSFHVRGSHLPSGLGSGLPAISRCFLQLSLPVQWRCLIPRWSEFCVCDISERVEREAPAESNTN